MCPVNQIIHLTELSIVDLMLSLVLDLTVVFAIVLVMILLQIRVVIHKVNEGFPGNLGLLVDIQSPQNGYDFLLVEIVVVTDEVIVKLLVIDVVQ